MMLPTKQRDIFRVSNQAFVILLTVVVRRINPANVPAILTAIAALYSYLSDNNSELVFDLLSL